MPGHIRRARRFELAGFIFFKSLGNRASFGAKDYNDTGSLERLKGLRSTVTGNQYLGAKTGNGFSGFNSRTQRSIQALRIRYCFKEGRFRIV